LARKNEEEQRRWGRSLEFLERKEKKQKIMQEKSYELRVAPNK